MENAVIGVLEFNSIAVGIHALDSMVKAAPIRIVMAKTICPGKYVIIVTGDVASVDASLTSGKESEPGCLIDELFIPNLNEQIIPAMERIQRIDIWDALGVIESFSVTASIEAGDTAAKEAQVKIPDIRLAESIGGKSYVKMIGSIEAVEAAMRAGVKVVQARGLLCRKVVIPQPHPDIRPFILQLRSDYGDK